MIQVEHSDIAFLLEEFGYLDISVAINNRLQEKDNYVTLYGSRITRADSVFIPTVGHTAIERYVHRGDPRIREAVNFMSDSSISYYIGRDDTDISSSRDLSPVAGWQSGRYNIFLLHFKPNGEILVY
jgi:hypothetical protein